MKRRFIRIYKKMALTLITLAAMLAPTLGYSQSSNSNSATALEREQQSNSAHITDAYLAEQLVKAELLFNVIDEKKIDVSVARLTLYTAIYNKQLFKAFGLIAVIYNRLTYEMYVQDENGQDSKEVKKIKETVRNWIDALLRDIYAGKWYSKWQS
jgi:hypothetical protein